MKKVNDCENKCEFFEIEEKINKWDHQYKVNPSCKLYGKFITLSNCKGNIKNCRISEFELEKMSEPIREYILSFKKDNE